AVNRAKETLTRTEHRILYDELGHDAYVRKRENGSISISKEFSERLKEAQNKDTEDTTQSSRKKRTDNIDSQVASGLGSASTGTDDSEMEQSGDKSESDYSQIGETSLETLTSVTAYSSFVSQVYREVWAIRLLLVLGLTVGLWQFNTLFATHPATSWLWQAGGVFGSLIGTSTIGVGTVIFTLIIITAISCLYGYARIPLQKAAEQIDDLASYDPLADNKGEQDEEIPSQSSDSGLRAGIGSGTV
ncbi:MAG: hypothetical protein ABEI86_00640, partial [Halobacteriaceae archaeon]